MKQNVLHIFWQENKKKMKKKNFKTKECTDARIFHNKTLQQTRRSSLKKKKSRRAKVVCVMGRKMRSALRKCASHLNVKRT